MTTGRIELGPTGRTVAANIKRLREGQGLSLRALSERLRDLDRKLSADALNKIENGRDPDAKLIRRVDADDLVAIAVALDVNPSALLFPPTVDGDAEVTGAGTITARDAWRWAREDVPLHVPEGDDGSAVVAYRLRALPQGIRKFNITTPAGRRAVLEADEGD